MVSIVPRLAAFFAVVLSFSLCATTAPSGGATPAHAAPTHAISCERNLTLDLRPGTVPPANADWNKPPARDMPPGPVIERFPLYPGATPSTVTMPSDAVVGILPTYRKVARAEFAVPAGYRSVVTWYQRQLAVCGLHTNGTMPLQQHGGPAFTGLEYIAPNWLDRLSILIRPLSGTTTAVLLVAQTLDLPARPLASLLHGPFTHVRVDYQSHGVAPGSSHRYRFTIAWPASVTRFVTAINRPTRVWVPVGSGGTVEFSSSLRLSFVRLDGGARPVSVGGVLDRVIVGRSRPLVDMNGRVLKLLSRILQRRCHSQGAC
jgi:hypothetical protein